VIVLDTNVISEVMRGHQASPAVLGWIRCLRETPVTTVVNRAEILAGIAVLPDGRRKERLREVADSAFDTLGVCLPLMPECAAEYAAVVAGRRSAGRPMGGMDALIAAIARVSGAAIATRDQSDFAGLDLELVDPWRGPQVGA
jgi:predicted nucleic acid-binding protein